MENEKQANLQQETQCDLEEKLQDLDLEPTITSGNRITKL
jgi:hypothetical protein